MNRIAELVDWLRALPGDFAFLLAIPFVVAAAALIARAARGGD